MKKKLEISDKDWLDTGWKYFQQHATQRMSYFNYFAIFSTILINGYVISINGEEPSLGIIIGLLEIILAFFFLKIEERNRFLMRHGENVIKKIEHNYFKENDSNYSLFTSEEIDANSRKERQRGWNFYRKEMSHGKAYKYLYKIFMIIGLASMIFATIIVFRIKDNQRNDDIMLLEINQLKKEVQNNKILMTINFDSVYSMINAESDSLKIKSE